MIPDLDIYRSANVLMKQHGEDAPIDAAMRADAMLEVGETEGYAVFRARLGVSVYVLTTQGGWRDLR